MTIDWFTVAAQIVNFLILVALLKHFLYGPIVRAMDKREETIKERLQEAEEKRKQADKKAADCEAKTAEIDRQKQDLLEQAKQEAEKTRKEQVRKAREETDALSREWRASVEREKESFLGELRRGLGRQAVAVARNALSDLADAPLERQVTAAFLARLQDIADDERAAIREGLGDDGGKVVVRSAFELTEEDRGKIDETLRSILGEDAVIDFQRSGDLMCGIELKTGGRKVAWTLEKHLEDAASEIAQALDQAAGPEHPDRHAGNGHS
jgi:F-type H+-transporting ATPase subunit b